VTPLSLKAVVGAADRFLFLRTQAAPRTAQRRADGGANLRSVDERTGRKPRTRDRAWNRLRELLGLYPAFRPLALLCLRLCVRRLSREFAVWRLSGRAYQGAREGFAERYLAMLAAGGTKHHSELLAPFGLDARDPAFWQIGLNMIEGMIVDLERRFRAQPDRFSQAAAR
jgi:hypothetical protein